MTLRPAYDGPPARELVPIGISIRRPSRAYARVIRLPVPSALTHPLATEALLLAFRGLERSSHGR